MSVAVDIGGEAANDSRALVDGPGGVPSDASAAPLGVTINSADSAFLEFIGALP
ncbi:hypothetical protein MycrhDRAFT_3382 [Mycolicibacterium rhodesiae JS60]|nr:hypothetical protein MycrhDRAFT_3382 [Mycolicibacterium rhodesiae JS60]